MLRFNFILRLNLTFILSKSSSYNYYQTPKHGEIAFEPSKKMSYSIYTIKIKRLLFFKQIKNLFNKTQKTIQQQGILQYRFESWKKDNREADFPAFEKCTCAQVFKWRQNQIHKDLYFPMGTGGQEPQHYRSPHSNASLSTSAGPSPPLHFAVQQPDKDRSDEFD